MVKSKNFNKIVDIIKDKLIDEDLKNIHFRTDIDDNNKAIHVSMYNDSKNISKYTNLEILLISAIWQNKKWKVIYTDKMIGTLTDISDYMKNMEDKLNDDMKKILHISLC